MEGDFYMDYNINNDNNFDFENKPKRKGVNIFKIISFFLAIILVFGGAVAFYVYNEYSASFEDRLTEYANAIDEKYNADIQKLQTKVDSLNLNSTLPVASSGDTTTYAQGQSLGVADIAQSVSPSIIGIRVTIPASEVSNGYFKWQTQAQQAEGSGIIISKDGYIATNYHVVQYIDQYKNVIIDVILKDGKEYTATFIGADEQNDLAVIKINETSLPVAQLGNSSDLVVGEMAVAIGNPLGISFAGSVTVGVISALDRTISGENVAEALIQTDAAINPGNSGGALINNKGQVIGINTIKISSTAVEGLGFAIPIDYAKPILESLIEYGYVKDRTTVGVTGEEITNTISGIYNIPTGLYVTDVTKNSGADIAGIKINDIILKFDGKEISTMLEMEDLKNNHKIGDIIPVTIYRDGETSEVSLMLLEDKS